MLFSIIGYLFWDYYTSFGTITFKPSWNGILTNSIKKDLLNSSEIYYQMECNHNIFSKENKRYMKNIKKITFNTAGISGVKGKIIIPDNVKEIEINYYRNKPFYDFNRKDLTINCFNTYEPRSDYDIIDQYEDNKLDDAINSIF